jgi:2-polyprenyl-3-methyl-5-hydroxy-6-metoxy-1,4-benzoquinol methylase
MIEKEPATSIPVVAVKRRAIGYSKSSLRYEPETVLRSDRSDRNSILLDWVGSGRRVLEVGCSTGYMSRLMAERNCVVTGIEVDPEAAERARNYCQEVHIVDLNVCDWINSLPKTAFDVVLLGDVLEHLVDPWNVLRQISEVLDAGGSIVISLPNVVHWMTRLGILLGQFDYQPMGTLDHTHLRFFTVKTARDLIESAGYRIVRFHPAIGGRMSGNARPVWQVLAHSMPGLFAYQFLFEARK